MAVGNTIAILVKLKLREIMTRIWPTVSGSITILMEPWHQKEN